MKGIFLVVGCGLLVGVIAWWLHKDEDEPDLMARYRAAYKIPNDEIRHARVGPP